MTIRTDITVDFMLSPRLITVAAPSAEVSIQDLYDTLRDIEDDMPNLDDDFLISGAGKEPLGGGVLVGVTASLNNAQLRFEARRTELQQGTVTTADATGVTLIDASAMFQTNLVSRGDFIVNHTDGSSAEVLTVDSEIQITTTGLGGGVDDQFEIGDSYDVFDVVQCNISGGNLVATDDVGDELESVFPTFGTQVIRTSASSATLQGVDELQSSAYGGGVTLDELEPITGTVFPFGTPRQPVNNITDALAVAAANGFTQIYVRGDVTLSSGDLTNFQIVGQSALHTTVTVTAGATTVGTEFVDVDVTGTFANVGFKNCIVRDITANSVLMLDTLIYGTVSLVGVGLESFILNSRDADTTGTDTTVDLNSIAHILNMKDYIGNIELVNKTSSSTSVIDLANGRITLASTVTAGIVQVRGIGYVVDNSTGTATIDDENLLSSMGGRSSALVG